MASCTRHNVGRYSAKYAYKNNTVGLCIAIIYVLCSLVALTALELVLIVWSSELWRRVSEQHTCLYLQGSLKIEAVCSSKRSCIFRVAMKMEAVCYSETLVPIYPTIRWHNPEDHDTNLLHRPNLTSYNRVCNYLRFCLNTCLFLQKLICTCSKRDQAAYRTFKIKRSNLEQWYSIFFVRVPPDIISLQVCTPKVVGV
jgi:hypothetical protein